MPRRHYISEEQVREIERERKKNKNKNVEKRLKALLLHAQGSKRDEIAKQTGYVKSYISELVAKYCKQGLSVVVDNNYHGNRRSLSLEEERELLDDFKKQAEQGQMIEINEIAKAYEKATGKSLEKSKGQIYKVLARNGWRKVMPRSKHPNKASDEEIESSKKLRIQ